jgi:hypothetical protein
MPKGDKALFFGDDGSSIPFRFSANINQMCDKEKKVGISWKI